MTELEPGHVIRFRLGAGGVDPGVYVILSDPTAPIVMVCLAGGIPVEVTGNRSPIPKDSEKTSPSCHNIID